MGRGVVERSPEAEADTDAAMKLVEASLAKVKPRHRDLGVRVADAFLHDPFRSAYELALANDKKARALAYVSVAAGFLSNYFDEGAGPKIRGASVQGLQVITLLLAKQKKGDKVARGLLDAMARAGLTGPNPG
jgi:hypothetical protein